MKFQNDPWRASWRFIRYDDYEIFDADDAYFDRQAKEIADAGFTHVMTFSNTHFRWSFRREFGRLTEVLRRQTAACHRHNLRIVEHHSANLSWNYGSEAQRREVLKQADPGRWPHFEEDMSLDSVYRGVRFGDLLQVSGRTGKPFLCFMNSYGMCHNNPDYRRFYFDYLDTLYNTGIDGIMTDDIQFLSGPLSEETAQFDMDSCACSACREKFRSQTGYELPEPGAAWEEFQRDRYAPRFQAWKRFRYESSLDFHRQVVKRYRRRGLAMLRPNYSATSVSWVSPWAFVFDDYPELDWAFVEHCCGIIRYSWPEYLFESIHCNMIARQRQIPALALYYPQRTDAQRLSWALALTAGQRYFGDPRRPELFAELERFHVFEATHFDSLFRGRENVRLAFFDSQMGRELDPDYNTVVRPRFNSWGQACLRRNLPWTMVNPVHTEEYARYRVIVVPGTRFLTDSEISALAGFAHGGGTLVWCDAAGSFDSADGKERPPERLAELLAPGAERVIRVGVGELAGAFTRRCRVRDDTDRDAFDCSEPTRWRPLTAEEKLRHTEIASFLAALLPDGADITVTPEVEDLLVSSFYTPDSGILSVRLANAAGTQSPPELPGFGESDPIPFPELAGLMLRIRLPEELAARRIVQARLSVPEMEPVPLEFCREGPFVSLRIPGKTVHDFALAEVFF